MTVAAGKVAELWRYPVKSLGGQQLTQAACGVRGIEGDRRWAVRGADGKLGSGKTTRRFRRMPGLLSMSSFLDGNDRVWVRFPGGDTGRVDDPATSTAVGTVVDEDVVLVEETTVSHFDDAPLHLLSSASLAGCTPCGQAIRSTGAASGRTWSSTSQASQVGWRTGGSVTSCRSAT